MPCYSCKRICWEYPKYVRKYFMLIVIWWAFFRMNGINTLQKQCFHNLFLWILYHCKIISIILFEFSISLFWTSFIFILLNIYAQFRILLRKHKLLTTKKILDISKKYFVTRFILHVRMFFYPTCSCKNFYFCLFSWELNISFVQDQSMFKMDC